MIVATVFMNWTGFAGLLMKGTYPIPSRRCDEKNDAEMAACKAPGIATVDNELIIDTEVFAYL